jgi:hypothetical protein
MSSEKGILPQASPEVAPRLRTVALNTCFFVVWLLVRLKFFIASPHVFSMLSLHSG